MNAAIFASAFHPSLGGVEELVRQLAHAHRREGTPTLVLTERWPRSLPAFEEYEGIPVFRFPMRVPDGSLRAHTSYWLTHSRIRRQVRELLVRQRIEVLHVQCVSSTAHYALAAQEDLKLPLVVSLQGELGMDAGGLFQQSAFARRLMRRALERGDRITACSAQTLDEAEKFRGKAFGKRARVVYNGIRLADFHGVVPHPHPRPYVLAIGRHVPQKGFDVLLNAYAQLLRASEADHDLILAGEGEIRGELERLRDRLGLQQRVYFTGRVDRQMAARLFTGCSFFVLPSRHEPLGIVNLEAMAAGKAVIASAVGGVPELVRDGETGLLVPGGDPAALAVALKRLISSPQLRETLGGGGKARAAEFDWSVIAAQYRELYQGLLNPADLSQAEAWVPDHSKGSESDQVGAAPRRRPAHTR